MKSYVKGEVKELDVGPDARRIQLCFGLLKKSLHKQQSQEENKESRIRAYEELLHKKEEEIRNDVFVAFSINVSNAFQSN